MLEHTVYVFFGEQHFLLGCRYKTASSATNKYDLNYNQVSKAADLLSWELEMCIFVLKAILASTPVVTQ